MRLPQYQTPPTIKATSKLPSGPPPPASNATQSTTSEDMAQPQQPCVFCDISSGKNTGQPPIYKDDKMFVVEDIKPHATHHLLVIPHIHLPNPKELTAEHSDLVRQMEDCGREALTERLGSVPAEDELLIGFHWPPLISIKHLHLHILYPASSCNFVTRHLVFRPDFLFVKVPFLLEIAECMC